MKSKIPFFIVLGILVVPVIVFFLLRNSTQVCKPLPLVMAKLDGNGNPVVGANGDTMHHQIPEFLLTNQWGQPYGSDSLKGNFQIADFIFTTCPTICKDISRNMANIQLRIKDKYPDIKLVSFTVDPEMDTPEVLKSYGERYGAVKGQWQFLTGQKDSLFTLINKGYKQSAVEDKGQIMKVTHSPMLVLVDPDLRFRGFYNVLDKQWGDKEFDRLMEEMDVLRCEYRAKKETKSK